MASNVNITIQQPGAPAAAPVQQQPQFFEYALMPPLVHADPGCIKVRHRAVMTTKMQCPLWIVGLNTCGCHNADAAMKRTYFEVHENRIEWNYGYPVCCGVHDLNGFYPFDSPMTENADVATCCQPACTHNEFCPTCCNMCGEALVIYPTSCVPRVFCCKSEVFHGLSNAHRVVEEVRKARMLAPARVMM